jgi:glycosyltransferase involved in cell wall biosynthesis
MKICYINPTNNIRRPIAELSNLLAEKGHEITVMYPSSKECPTKNWVANDSVKNGKIKQLPIKSWYFAPLRYSFPNLIDLFKATKKIYKENDKIHIWEYYYPISVIPLIYSLLKGTQKQKKTILTTDGFVGYSYKPKDPRWLVPAFKVYTNLIGRILFRIPGKMTTYGNPMIPYAKKAGVPMKKLKILSTGIHLKKFENINMNKVHELREEFGIKNEKVILYAGMLTERKGIKKIIKISSKLLDEGYKIKTLIIGDAHGENIYAKLVRPKYRNQIIFTGGRKEIPEFMRLADVFFLPSDGEGLPGVVMESMASGLPVVATNEGCTSDLIENGVEGFLVKLGDKGEGYYNAVKDLLNDEHLAEVFKINAKKKIATFSWKDVGERYLNI